MTDLSKIPPGAKPAAARFVPTDRATLGGHLRVCLEALAGYAGFGDLEDARAAAWWRHAYLDQLAALDQIERETTP